jgi:tRNA A37 methylthiotransferase MiaB
MEYQVEAAVSKGRSRLMSGLVKRIQVDSNSKWVGWRGTVLVDEVVKNAFVGRNYAYKPCLIKADLANQQETLLGKEAEVIITGATSSTLRATLAR